MEAWVLQHGRLLGRVALSAAIAAVAAPVIALLIGIPYLFGGVPYPPVNPMQVALVVSGVLGVVGMATGIAVWRVRAPGYGLGMAAVVVLGTIFLMVGSILLTGYVMSISHSQVRE